MVKAKAVASDNQCHPRVFMGHPKVSQVFCNRVPVLTRDARDDVERLLGINTVFQPIFPIRLPNVSEPILANNPGFGPVADIRKEPCTIQQSSNASNGSLLLKGQLLGGGPSLRERRLVGLRSGPSSSMLLCSSTQSKTV